MFTGYSQNAYALPNSVDMTAIDLEAGTISITVTDDDDATDITGFNATSITIFDGTNQSGNPFTLTSDSSTSVGGTSLSTVVTIGETDLYNIKDQLTESNTTFSLRIAAGGIATDGTSAGVNAADLDTVVDRDPTDDSSAPLLSTNVLDLDAEPATLILTFDEGVTVPTIGDIVFGGDPDYTLTTSTVTSGSAGDTSFTITLSDVDKYNVNLGDDNTNDMDYTTALVSDGAGTTIAAVSGDTFSGITEDTTAPLLTNAALDLDIGDSTLTLTFDEFVHETSFNASSITITDSSDANGVTLSAASPNESADGLTMTIALTNAERTAIAAHTGTSRLDAALLAWDDVSIAANANLVVADRPMDSTDEDDAGPTITNAALDLDIGDSTLTLTFDENVDESEFNAAAITITDSSDANGVPLSAASPNESADGLTMTIALTNAERTAIAAHTGTSRLDATALAWDDTAETPNANAVVADRPMDSTDEDDAGPTITNAALDLDIGDSTLTLTFDENVDESEFNAAAITITDSSDANGVPLSAASPNESADGLTMTIALTNAERTAIAAHTGTSRLDATALAWDDTAETPNANAVVADRPMDSTDEDDAGPTITNAALDLDIGDSTLTLTFDENVDESEFNAAAITITDSSDANGVPLSAASPNESADGLTMTIALTNAERTAIAAHTGTSRLDATALAWDDTAETPNANAVVADRPMDSTDEDDAGPTITNAALDLDIGDSTLTLTFDENVDESEFNAAAITITDSSDANGVPLSAASPNESADGLTMTIALTNAERTAIAAHTGTSRLDATALAWDDTAETPNANAVVADRPMDSTDEDDAGPLIATSTLNLDGDSPTLVLTFDETVDFSTFYFFSYNNY